MDITQNNVEVLKLDGTIFKQEQVRLSKDEIIDLTQDNVEVSKLDGTIFKREQDFPSKNKVIDITSDSSPLVVYFSDESSESKSHKDSDLNVADTISPKDNGI